MPKIPTPKTRPGLNLTGSDLAESVHCRNAKEGVVQFEPTLSLTVNTNGDTEARIRQKTMMLQILIARNQNINN